MASKKTLMVNFVRSGRRRWFLSLEGTDAAVLGDVVAAVKGSAERRGVPIVNATSPFGEAKQPERMGKKKDRKQRSDKGAKRAEHPAGDGQVGAGAA